MIACVRSRCLSYLVIVVLWGRALRHRSLEQRAELLTKLLARRVADDTLPAHKHEQRHRSRRWQG